MTAVAVLKAPRSYSVRRTADQQADALAAGAALLESTAKRLRLWGKLRLGTITEAQRQAIASRISLDARHEIAALTDRLITGHAARADWEARVAKVVGPGIYAGILANVPQPTEADIADADRVVAAQLSYLRRTRTEIGTGQQAKDGTLRVRADQYGGAVWTEAMNATVRRAQRDGYTEYRSVLGPADHCTTKGNKPGCKEEAAKGWRKIGTLAPLGSRRCHSRCHCSWEFRKRKATQVKAAAPPASATAPTRRGPIRRVLELPGVAARAVIGAARRVIGR